MAEICHLESDKDKRNKYVPLNVRYMNSYLRAEPILDWFCPYLHYIGIFTYVDKTVSLFSYHIIMALTGQTGAQYPQVRHIS